MDTFSSALGELFPGENMEGSEDLSSEWLSIYVEDCYTTTSHPIPAPTTTTTTTTTSSNPNPQSPLVPPPPPQNPKASLKDRPKRRKSSPRAHPYDHFPHTFHADPPLLHQTHWLAESELLIFPKKEQENKAVEEPAAVVGDGEEDGKEEEEGQQQQQQQPQPRRCTHCLSQRTPQWRQGPLGPKTLCNACGVRFKSGRLLPEYRPAKSPTFESYKHSNSHKKVMEMRMALLSSHSS